MLCELLCKPVFTLYIKNGCHVSVNRIKLCSLIPDFVQVKYDFDINIVSYRASDTRLKYLEKKAGYSSFQCITASVYPSKIHRCTHNLHEIYS